MSEDRTGRELTPRPSEPEGVVTPREPSLPAPTTPTEAERFNAGEQTHTVGLTEERAAEIVRQSSNARYVAFAFVLLFVLFIPLYWLYDIGLPVVGVQPRLEKEADEQYITDVSRGYALFLANCARCHGDNGQGGIGPPLNDQAKLFNTLTAQGLPGPGHLNPDYLHKVLEVGGRYVCGDPNSVMPVWLQPGGPLNYREVEELIDFILATKDTQFVYAPAIVEGGGTPPPPVDVQGWRDPAYTPAPGATPVPACWRAPAGGGGTTATPAPISSPGTPASPRVIEIHASPNLAWVDANNQPLSAISVVPGETVQFHVVNETPIGHNFHVAAASDLSSAPEHNDLPGVDTFTNTTQDVTYAVPTALPDQPQFACTVPGHYQTMHGDLLAVTPGGTAGSPIPGSSPAPASQPAQSAPPQSAAPQASSVP